MEKVQLILGPPGTGKTTQLLNEMNRYISQGIDPGKIGFISFTKKAVEEAAERAMKKFSLQRKALNFFRTIHSLAFHRLGMSTSDVLQVSHYRDLGKQIGIRITGSHKSDLDAYDLGVGDQGIFIESLARLKCQSLNDTWVEFGSDITWLEVLYIAQAIDEYKKVNLLYDYTDMLVRFYDSGVPPELDVLFIDEAQDLCLLQWKIIDRLIKSSKNVIIAGDDDQAIFRWSGAATDYFVNLVHKIKNTRTLDKSYRLPVDVKEFADKLICRITNRKIKNFTPTKDKGDVEFINSIEHIDFSAGNWLILVRNNYLVKPIIDHMRYYGYVYKSPYGDVRNSYGVIAAFTWEKIRTGNYDISRKERSCLNGYLKKHLPQNLANIDSNKLKKPWYEILDMPVDEIEYYKAARRLGESFIKEPRIVISTIHGAKGAECENVVVLTDMSLKTYNGYIKDVDSEVRVFYVAVTRSLKNLKIVQPQTNNYFLF